MICTVATTSFSMVTFVKGFKFMLELGDGVPESEIADDSLGLILEIDGWVKVGSSSGPMIAPCEEILGGSLDVCEIVVE